MQAVAFVRVVVGVLFTIHAGTLGSDPSKETESEEVARLIKQLGDDAFEKREAASKELADIGAPAINALRKAATSRDDLEIRRRAERIIQTISNRAIERQLAAFNGIWNIEFTNGVKEVCEIRKDRTASVVEPLRTSNGKVEVKDGSVVIVYQDDRVERWAPVGKRMVVEHWYPGAQFPTGRPVLGIADSAR